MSKKKLSVQVGKRFINRNGIEIEILRYDSTQAIFYGAADCSRFQLAFNDDGTYADRTGLQDHSLDLVEEVNRSFAV
jgi:hypothetical protein